MEMKPMYDQLPYIIVYGMSFEERPYIHGYALPMEREQAYMNYVETGVLYLWDAELGIEQKVEPIYVSRMDFVDGMVNVTKV